MELIGTCELKGFTIEAYFPERGKEDIWTLWVMKDGRIVHEVELRMAVESPYGIDHHVQASLDHAATRAVDAMLRKEVQPRRPGWQRLAAA